MYFMPISNLFQIRKQKNQFAIEIYKILNLTQMYNIITNHKIRVNALLVFDT